jgi:predicted AAA+ superfamily ATPase
LWETLFVGAYPRIHDRELEPTQWLGDYVSTYVQMDVRQIRNVTDLDAFTRFLRLVAGRTACELHPTALGADAGASAGTVRSWVSVLAASFVVFTLPAWHRNVRKQAIKAPKLHLFDSGVCCYLLGVTDPEQLRRHPLRGAVFESWVASEIYKSRAHAGRPAHLFHFRDAKGLEVDLVIEEGGRACGVEVKSGQTVAGDFFRGLRGLREAIRTSQPDLRLETCLVYGGVEAQRRSDAEVLPWSSIQDRDWP